LLEQVIASVDRALTPPAGRFWGQGSGSRLAWAT
jgi:hypothetical protein